MLKKHGNMKILPNTQRLGKLTFDSNQVKKSKTNPNVLIAKASDGKDYGVVRKNDGSYDFAGSSRNATFGDRMATASANPNIGTRLLDTAGLLMSEPQRMMTRALTNNRYNNPEEVVADSKLPDGMLKNTLGFAAGMLADPFNAVGAGAGAKFAKMLPSLAKSSKMISKISNNNYKTNSIFNKENKVKKWFDEEMRLNRLPETTNKQSIEVLDNFKQRIKTPEGQKRLKELGILEDSNLQELKIVEDPNTFGYYAADKNRIAIHPNHPLPEKVVRHEIEHGVQTARNISQMDKVSNDYGNFKYLFNRKKGIKAKMDALKPTTEIDDILSDLKLRKEVTPNKVWNTSNDNNPVDISQYKSLINEKQRATDYFLTGSDGREKSAFLGEVQQYMMDKGIIPKKSYTQVTPEMVEETMADAIFDEQGGGKYLRLFNIIKADPKNYELISKGLNKMLTVTPLVTAGAAASTMSNKDKNNKFKYGGKLLPLLNKF
jgi:hypothetical protein